MNLVCFVEIKRLNCIKFLCLKKKQKIIINYIIGPLLFVWLSFSIYNQLKSQPDLSAAWHAIKQSLNGPEAWKFYLVVLLMFVNWGIEAKKWQILVSSIQNVSFLRAFRAIFTGQAIALNTFNGVGEYVGRVVYLEGDNRLRGIALSIVGSFSQIIITLVAGLLGLLFVRIHILNETHHLLGISKFWIGNMMFSLAMISLTLITLVLILIYFQLSWLTKLIEKVPFVAKYSFYIQKLEDFSQKELTKILFLSLVRYLVFVAQYLLLLQLFNVNANWWQLSCMVAVKFLVLAVVPTIPLAELGVRGEISKELFGLISSNTLGIVFTAALIWFINRVIPAFAGTVLILGIKLFKNKTENKNIAG